MVQLRSLLAATLSGSQAFPAQQQSSRATELHSNFRGRLEIQYDYVNQELRGQMDSLKVCVLNFNYNPDPRRCENAPEGRLESKSEIGIYGTGQVALSGLGSRQTDLPFTAVWPGDLSVITWTGDEARPTRVHSFSGELKAAKDWKRINVEGVHLTARVTCLPPFYGEDCDTICQSPSEKRKKTLGHYSCDENGEKVCDRGFTTEPGDELPCMRRIPPANCLDWDRNGRCHSCEEGYFRRGRTCELRAGTARVITSPCADAHCGPNSNCVAKGESFQCICAPGFVGSPCLPIVSAPLREACTATCVNNGVCIEGNKCACPEGFTGEFCEVEEKDNLLLGIVAGIMFSVLGALLVVAGVIVRRRSRMQKATTAQITQAVFDEEEIMEEAAHSRAEGELLLSPSTLQAAYSKPGSPNTRQAKISSKVAKNLQEASFATTSSGMSLSELAPPSYNEALQS